MSRPFVYLAGPIFGKTVVEAKGWRDYARRYLEDRAVVAISPLRCEPQIGGKYELDYADNPHGTAEGIAGKNKMDVARCDIMLVHMPKTGQFSIGTLIEIGWASAQGKPIVLATENEILRLHPLMVQTCGWRVPHLPDALEIVVDLMGVYAQWN